MANIKVPPHNEDAEQSVLGAILIDKDAINEVASMLSPTDFYNDTNNIIYTEMVRLFHDSKPIDTLTLTSGLKKKKLYEKVGASYLSDLVNSVPTAANIEEYARLIKDAATKRLLIRSGGEMVELAFAEEEVKHILDKAESALFSISQGHTTQGFIPIKVALAESFDRIDDMHRKGETLRGVHTGFTDLDNLLSGMQDSNLLILAARPGQGKTALAMNIAQYVGVKEKKGVGIFSLEMSKEELVDRLLVNQADIDAWRLKTRKLTEDDYDKISLAMGELGEASIFIDDTPGISVAEIRSRARKLMLAHPLKLIVVDYLQLINPGKRMENRVQEVSLASQGLKNLARELKIPVLALSQLNRSVEHRGERKPQLADLRESGAIEQDADVVMFIYRPDEEITPTVLTKLLIAKHRNGPVGEIDLLFRGDRIRFYNIEKKRGGE
ncbi:MAG: replicative DNA helicase [Patescibacteria group bacterium]